MWNLQCTQITEVTWEQFSTEAEVVGVDDASSQILWTNYFIKAQGYYIDNTLVCQDNQSAILLEKMVSKAQESKLNT